MKRTYSQQWEDYELIDAGNDKKIERWGEMITIRPDRNAYFSPILSMKEWKEKAHFEFIEEGSTSGFWKELKPDLKKTWKINYKASIFNLQLTKFKHIGLFPEQQTNWEFINKRLKKSDRFLNLFAYTGGASLNANLTGANVYHCDSVKQIISWAKKNMEDSKQSDIHWVLEDALKFANREVKRGNHYQGIIMDPPAFGIGIKKERWKIEHKFHELVRLAKTLLTPEGFLIINTYSPKLKEKEILSIINTSFPRKTIEVSKLCLKSTTGKTIEYGELTRVYS